MRITRYLRSVVGLVLVALLLEMVPIGRPVETALATDIGPELEMYEFGGGGYSTKKIAVGDFNADGYPDLFFANYQHDDQVLLGSRDGTFTYSTIFETFNRRTMYIATGDINSDGNIDIVRGNLRRVNEVLLGNGDGTFREPYYILEGTEQNTTAIALGDFNGDRIPDLITANWNQASHVYVGNGDGTFTSKGLLDGSGRWTSSVVVGHFNRDGFLDIVLGNMTLPSQLFLGNGDGTFQESRDLPTGQSNTMGIAAGDLNGDAFLDVVFANNGHDSQFVLGLGDGTFQHPQRLVGGSSRTQSAAVGDINTDGRLDIVLGNDGVSSQMYQGNGDGTFMQPLPLSDSGRTTSTVLIADFNGDGTHDILLGNYQEKSQAYFSHTRSPFPPAQDIPQSGRATAAVAVGDVDADGRLDLVLANQRHPSQILIGQGNGRFSAPKDLLGSGRDTRGVAVGDLNNDQKLDLVLANYFAPSQVFLGLGDGHFAAPFEIGQSGQDSVSVAVGDLNNDGMLDLVLGNDLNTSAIYLGNGSGRFPEPLIYVGNSGWGSRGLALGDIDRDGILDLVLSNALVYRGYGNGHFYLSSILIDDWRRGRRTFDVALGDLNGDGALDALLGNQSQLGDRQASQLYNGTGDGLFHSAQNMFSAQGRAVVGVGLADMNGDGRLDIVLANQNEQSQVAFQKVSGGFATPTDLPNGTRATSSLALGDLDEDGTTDVVLGNINQPSQVILNPRPGRARGQKDQIDVRIRRPVITPDAAFFSTPRILDTPVISIPYTLRGPADRPANRVLGFYSMDGGGNWQTAVPTDTATTDLAVSPEGTQHVFRWDTAASNLFGQSSNLVFRLVVLPSLQTQTHQSTPVADQLAPSTMSMPFQVRGTQVRVMHKNGWPAYTARVYRLRPGEKGRAVQIPPQPNSVLEWGTEPNGYLKGRIPLAAGDQLMAIMPLSATDTYTMYWTSAPITPEGVDFTPVLRTGVQTLTVSPEQPLILFNLDISLEWDARNDSVFQSSLKDYLQRASALLFRWSGGQAALGDLRIFNNRERWDTAHIRLYATNRMRPNAAQGGITSSIRGDPQRVKIAYVPGQIRMGAVWNRYGDITAQLGDDWASTLAHELGHYALYLDDNYLGLDAQGRLISVAGCPGPMTDPYLENYGSFHPTVGWLPACEKTLSHQETGRSDWATIKTFYQNPKLNLQLPFLLNEPTAFNPALNPKNLAVDFTRLRFDRAFASGPSMLGSLTVKLVDAQNNSLIAKPSATGFLFQGDRLLDLGAPALDQLLVRGAADNDRVCVFELERRLLGCQALANNFQHLQLIKHHDWQPDLTLTPVTSTTMQLEVTGLPPGLKLRARLYPSGGVGLPPVDLAQTPGLAGGAAAPTYTVNLKSPGTPVFEGYIHLFVDEVAPRRELVMDFRSSGNPGLRWHRSAPRGNPGLRWHRSAPILSSDGQAILYGPDTKLQEGQFYMLQRALNPPPPPVWATPVGRAYRLTTTLGVPLNGSSLNINYLATDVSDHEEKGIQVLFWNPHHAAWEALPTRSDTARNEASASVDRPGIYMLMTSTLITLTGPKWNLLDPYLGATQAVIDATTLITDSFSTIFAYNPANLSDPWQQYDPDVPPEWQPVVNDLKTLSYGEIYRLYATKTVTWTTRYGKSTFGTQSEALWAARDTADDFTIQMTAAPPTPPSTFYGVAPAAGLLVEALIDGRRCGAASSAWFGPPDNERPVFAIHVRAATGVDCGTPGKAVTIVFKDGTRTVERRSATWDNTRAQLLEPVTDTHASLNGPGWNLLAPYPGATQPITIATSPIDGRFSTIYTYDQANPNNPWHQYDPAVPSTWSPLVNNLAELAFDQNYWIHTTEPVSWTIPHNGKTFIGVTFEANVSADGSVAPPATFYGVAPAENLSVEATVGGQPCGSTTTRPFGPPGQKRPSFVIRVRATGDGPGTCGAPGRTVTLTFRSGTRIVERVSAPWDNTRAHLLTASTASTIPLTGPGWNLLAPYPGATQPVTVATSLLAGKFTTVFAYDQASPDTPWRQFDPAVPTAWSPAVNDLASLAYGQSYWIYVSKTFDWDIRRGESVSAAQPEATLPPPPATFYGTAPAGNLFVEATLDGQPCGSTSTRLFGPPGQRHPIFVFRVHAAGDGVGCGTPGRSVTITFKEGERIIEQRLAAWDNTRAQLIESNQAPSLLVYLPLIHR